MNHKILILLLFLQPIFFWAQGSGFHFKHLSTADGLSSSSVIAIEQDSQGNMWFGTRNGLNKYNGATFEVFRNDENDANSLGNSDVLSVIEDGDGNIWAGTYNGLNKYDPIKNVFKRYTKEQNNEHSLINNVVICSKEMPNGEIWFGTANGISIYSKVKDAFTNIPYIEKDGASLPSRNIQRIFLDSNKQIWIATTGGLAKLINRNGNKFLFKQFKRTKDSQNLFIQDVVEIEPNMLALATKYNGYILFNKTTEKFITNVYPEISSSADVRVLKLANDGNIWLGMANGVKIISPDSRVYNIKSNRHNVAGLSQNFVKSIFKDNNGSIWLGTYSGGANIWNEVNENFINFRNYTLDNNVVSAIMTDNKSNLYFGTEGGKITILNTKSKSSDFITVYDDKKLKTLPIQALLISEPNVLWVGVLNYGIFVYDIKTKKKLNHIISKELKAYLQNTGVYVIKKGLNGVFWFGTFGKGLVRYDSVNKTFRVFGYTLGEEPRLSTNIIKTILIDKNKNIWAGGLGGLNVIRFKDDGSFEVDKYFKDFLSDNNIKTIYEDSKHNIWVGTSTKGLQKFNGTDDFDRITIDDQNQITTIYTILEGQQGHLWISCDKGIVEYNPFKKTSVIYNQKDVTNTNEFNPNSGSRLGTTQFYFGGPVGVTAFNSKKIVKNYFAPQVILSDLKIKNQSVKIDGDDHVLFKNIAFTKEIALSHDNSNFSINYAIPNFINSDNNKYAYRLIGLDKTWSYTNNTEAYYTLQTPGKYIFEVKGANNDGVWNDTSTTLKITVKPAPWRSWWALTLYGLLIAFGIYGLIWIMKSKTNLQHKLDLEYVESERNKEINQAKLQFFTNISHEFRTPLTLILGPLQQVLADYTGTNVMYKKLMVIESSANHLLRLINRLMDFRKLENNQAQLETAEGNIVKFLQEIYLSFSEYAKNGNYYYTFNNSHEEILVHYDRYKLERVFYNLISNAFRYTPKGGDIAVEIKKKGNLVLIQVQDSGVGISEEYIDKIFDRFFEIPIHNRPEKKYNEGTGIGLSIANNIVKLHHGTIQVQNNDTEGVVFNVELPLGRAHLSENEILKDFKMSDDVEQYVSQLDKPINQLDEDLNDLVSEEKKYTLLLVEDNKSLRSFMKDLLKDDYNILQAENGKVAFKKAKKHLPDLIISDVIMPEMVGTELCSQIKETLKTSHIPVILLTSRTSLIYKFEGLESGADDYISKPFNLKEFRLRIKNLLESKQRLKDKFSTEETFSPSDITVTSMDEELLKKAFKIVENNISNESFDVIAFSTELGISRSMLFTKIKAWTNFTPNEFVMEIRLKTAAQLLEQDKINIAQVGYKVGFLRPKYFTKCFKKKYGLTPSQYINKFIDDAV